MTQSNSCLDAQCPIQFVLDILDGKWSILMLRELFMGERRTNDFLAALPGMSVKTLTLRLRKLEQYQLVHRQAYVEIPPRVVYSITDKGRTRQPVMAGLHQVGEKWLEQDQCACPLVTLNE